MTTEAEVQDNIRLTGPKHSSTLFRNNTGALKDETGRVVRYGLANESKEQSEKIKSSDLIGITSIIVTPDMVGKRIGIFTAVEVKRPDWKYKGDKRETAQRNFIDFIKSCGGFRYLSPAPHPRTSALCPPSRVPVLLSRLEPKRLFLH